MNALPLEATGFRLCLLIGVCCFLFYGGLAVVDLRNATHARVGMANADSVIALRERWCREGRSTLACDAEETASHRKLRDSYNLAALSAESDAQQLTFLGIFWTALAFTTFYVVRWLLTGRSRPFWPLRKPRSRVDRVAG